jgi:monoamine oxidase
MGAVARIVLRFRERFWEHRPELAPFGFLHSFDPAVPTWWTALPVRVPLLTGWAAGPAAAQFAGQDRASVAARAAGSLARLLGMPEAALHDLLVACHWHDWQSDPYARGAYSYVPAGAMDARRALARPVEDTLFFAGEATEVSGHSAMVHGAIRTGRRAAAEVLRAMQP